MNAVEYEIFHDDLRAACQQVAKKWGITILPADLPTARALEIRALRQGIVLGLVAAIIGHAVGYLIFGI